VDNIRIAALLLDDSHQHSPLQIVNDQDNLKQLRKPERSNVKYSKNLIAIALLQKYHVDQLAYSESPKYYKGKFIQ